MWALGALAAIVALAMLGQRVAPPQQAANSAEARQSCKIEAPDDFKAAGRRWCAVELFARVSVTADKDNLITVAQFSPNGAQAWQLQSTGLVGEFRMLTDRMASESSGRNVAVDVHDAADQRVAACARLSTEAAAVCEVK